MIKKFKQYIKEGAIKAGGNIYEILSIEDIDDQFLRLKEVLNCTISIYTASGTGRPLNQFGGSYYI